MTRRLLPLTQLGARPWAGPLLRLNAGPLRDVSRMWLRAPPSGSWTLRLVILCSFLAGVRQGCPFKFPLWPATRKFPRILPSTFACPRHLSGDIGSLELVAFASQNLRMDGPPSLGLHM